MTPHAVLSPDGLYRYSLIRAWDGDLTPGQLAGLHQKLRILFVMLNPSTADALVDDPTIRKCLGFIRTAQVFGGEGAVPTSIEVVNLFAYRTTHPKVLLAKMHRGVDVVGPENDDYIRGAVQQADDVVVAWGANSAYYPGRVDAVKRLLPPSVWCLSRTRRGSPGHPLMLPYSTKPVLVATSELR